MATIQELESFNLNDAVKFHKELNPRLWDEEKLDPEVRDQLLLIAEDFVEYLGIDNLKVEDVTISGSNAAYSYTPHSDLDLHILVNFNNLPDDPVYQELFTAKKTLYNDAHDITVREVPVELYVQDTNQVHTSLGEYSVVYDKWIRIPKKRRANFDQAATKLKYEKLGDLIELALKTRDSKRVKDTIDLVKRYRKSGLERAGEFGPENLAFKAIRKQGLIQDLYDLKAELHGEKLSIDEASSRDDAMIKIKKLLNTAGRTDNEKQNIKRIIDKMMKQWNIDPNEVGIREPVDPIKAKMAKSAYAKSMSSGPIKKGIFAEDEPDKTPPVQGKKLKKTVDKIVLSTDPSWYGAEVGNYKASGPVVNISASQLVGFEPDDKMNQPKSKANVKKIVAGLKQGDKIPPLLVRKYKNGYQVLDGHHRFWAYKLLGVKSIPAQIVPDSDIEEKGKKVEVKEYVDDIKSYKNPSPKTLYNLTKRSAHKHMRGMYHNGNTYWWDANDAIHADGSKLLGIPYDYLNRLEAAIDNVSGTYYVGGDDNVPKEITQRYDVEDELISEDQLDETAEENQIVNVVSNIAADAIINVMKAKESKLLDLLDTLAGDMTSRGKLHLFGVKVKDLNVPNVNNPLLKKLFNILTIRVLSTVYFRDGPSEPKTLGAYYDGEYTIELFFPALEYAAGKRESQLKTEIASTLSHEIQHAIDDYKSDSVVYSGDNANPAKDMQSYLKLPYEVNARFQEATMDIAKYIAMPQKDGSKITQADLPDLIRYAFQKNRLDKIYEKNQKEYKRLLSRAYKFFQAELNAPKKATPIPQSIAKRALAWILGKQTKEIAEASGYIPSEKEKNDPRFKMALTVDVKPDSIKKNAKAFGFKTSRAGIPPQARADGKIAEDLMREWKSFLAETAVNKDVDVNYHMDEGRREKSQTVTLYHGTCEGSAQQLLATGWSPSSGQQGGNMGQSRYLYCSTQYDDALWFAQEKGCDTVLTLVDIPVSSLRVDPEDGTADTLQDELNLPHELPGKVVVTKPIGPENFRA